MEARRAPKGGGDCWGNAARCQANHSIAAPRQLAETAPAVEESRRGSVFKVQYARWL